MKRLIAECFSRGPFGRVVRAFRRRPGVRLRSGRGREGSASKARRREGGGDNSRIGLAASRARRCLFPRTPCTGFAACRARRCPVPRTPCIDFAASRARRCPSPRTPYTSFAPSRARRCPRPRTPCTRFAPSRARRSPSPGTPCSSTLVWPCRARTPDRSPPPRPTAAAFRGPRSWRRAPRGGLRGRPLRRPVTFRRGGRPQHIHNFFDPSSIFLDPSSSFESAPSPPRAPPPSPGESRRARAFARGPSRDVVR
jgi:hypothetical protein